jgi:PASTA domain-containing protein
MRWVIVWSIAVIATTAGCSADAPAEPPPTVTVTVTAPAPPATAPPPARASTGTSWTMPDLVGSNLQDAQNAVQDLTEFQIPVTTSHDSTGAGRQQVVDRNWKVCSQSVAPGTTITKGARIDFGTVQLDETCR